MELINPYSIRSANEEQILGKHTEHLMDKILVVFEEGRFQNKSQTVGTLNSFITEPTILIEPKGGKTFLTASFHRLMVTTNQPFFIPITKDERRWFALDISDSKCLNTEYFKGLSYWFGSGGKEALMHYFYNLSLSDSISLRKPPITRALLNQKLNSLLPTEKWWFECLEEGRLISFENDLMQIFNSLESTEIKPDGCVQSCNEYFEINNITKRISKAVLGKFLRRFIPDLEVAGNKSRKYIFPALPFLRKHFENQLGGIEITWE
jgi:hypothetical protein